MTDRTNENLAEDEGTLEDEAILKSVAGGSDGQIYKKACPICGEENYGIEVLGRVSYSCSNHDSIYHYC